MLRTYLKTALRHLKRQPGYTAINILGLTLGISSSLIIILYLFNELNYDQQHEKKERVFRISSDIRETDDAFKWASSQSPLGRKMKEDFAEVENYVRFFPNGRTKLELDDQTYFEEKVFSVDSTIFNVFTFDFIAGDMSTALDAPNSVVLSQTVAAKIFKGENPIGKLLKIDDQPSRKVTGVFIDMPTNSHIRADVLISTSGVERLHDSNWGSFYLFTYVLLDKVGSEGILESKLNEIIEENVVPIFKQYDITIKYEMLNIADIHLHSDFEGEPEATGSMEYVFIFAAVLLFMICIACINYMNLATARSTKRATEVGIRKMMGAKRGRLVGQFLTESMILTIVAFLLSLSIISALIPLINNNLDTNLNIEYLYSPTLIVAVILITLFTGIIGGSYPAFFLSGFSPAAVLKGSSNGKTGHNRLRQGLVIVQFSISIFMLIGTAVIYDQMNFVSSSDMGFDKDQVVSFNLNNDTMRNKWSVVKNKLLQNPDISTASTSTSYPGNGYSKNLMNIESNEGVMEQKGLNLYGVDYDYFPTLNIDIVSGRNFSYDFVTDTSSAVLINEAMVKRMNWSDAIGKKIQFGTNDTLPISRVVGVVKDFHQLSLYNSIEPMLFFPTFNNNNVLVKIDQNLPQSLSHIESVWKEVFPTQPFEYTFIEDNFLEQYESDQQRGTLFLSFSLMTIAIACLGLLGLSSYTAEQRTKEISIRKVLGASTPMLIRLLIKDFLLLALIGALPAFLAAWYFMGQWLDNFVYHVNLNIGIFLTVLFMTILITILSTGYFALTAARSNPADNLKCE